jgi:hypothetical protein
MIAKRHALLSRRSATNATLALGLISMRVLVLALPFAFRGETPHRPAACSRLLLRERGTRRTGLLSGYSR